MIRLVIRFWVKLQRLVAGATLVCVFSGGGSRGACQTAIRVGAGSYASSVPPSAQWQGGYFSMTAQQVVTQFAKLHLAAAVTNRPIPSNKWWIDLLVGDRSSQPSPNAPRRLVQDNYGGQLWVYPGMVDPEPFGLNLYFPNAWTPGGADKAVPQGPFMTGPALPITGRVTMAIAPADILLADFEGAAYPAGWLVTGTAFGTGPVTGGGWPGQIPAVQGFFGGACVNSYRGGDSPQGTLTSPEFMLEKHYIHLLAGGGSNLNLTAVNLLIGTNVVKTATGRQSGALDWNTWDVSRYLGRKARIQIVDASSGSWGFILCDFIVASDTAVSPAVRYSGSYSPLHAEVTDWSDWGVQFSLPDALGNRMDVTLARGVPFVWTTCRGVNPQINCGPVAFYDVSGNEISRARGRFTSSAFAFEYQGRTFGVFAPKNTLFISKGGLVEAQLLATNNYLVYGFLPSRTNLAHFVDYAYARVTNTVCSWVYDPAKGRVNTFWALGVSPLQGSQINTLQGWLPHHYRRTGHNLDFEPDTYLTPRGIMKLSAGNRFEFGFNFRGLVPVIPEPLANHLMNDYVPARMTNYVAGYAAAHPVNVGDSYGAGKEVALSAEYLCFARQLGLTNQIPKIAAGLRSILSDWFTYTPGEQGNFFARYDNWRALVGFPPGYGSEAFNDNHFHYGYFMVATALLGMEDPDFLRQYGPMARLVAKQYANWDRADTSFPFLRTYDLWEGHSYAAGFGSGGGNNQESSSEAMNSWVGLFLLGSQMGDQAMTAAGAMGYAMESTAVNEYWQDMYRINLPPSYGKGVAGIVWSGGLTYGTYFTGDPAWIYGIQWVPAAHWNNYMVRDKAFAKWHLNNMWRERIESSEHGLNGFKLTDGNNATALGGYLGNYVLGYQALFDPAGVAAVMDAAFATNATIATDNNYSGVTYYIAHSLRALGDQDLDWYTSLPTSQVYYNAVTGRRTYVLYNPALTNQTAMVYHLGLAVERVSVPAGKLTVILGEKTNSPVKFNNAPHSGAGTFRPPHMFYRPPAGLACSHDSSQRGRDGVLQISTVFLDFAGQGLSASHRIVDNHLDLTSLNHAVRFSRRPGGEFGFLCITDCSVKSEI